MPLLKRLLGIIQVPRADIVRTALELYIKINRVRMCALASGGRLVLTTHYRDGTTTEHPLYEDDCA